MLVVKVDRWSVGLLASHYPVRVIPLKAQLLSHPEREPCDGRCQRVRGNGNFALGGVPESIQPFEMLPLPKLHAANTSTAWTMVVLGALSLSNFSSASAYSANGAASARMSEFEDICAPIEQQAYTRGAKPESMPVEPSSNICRKYSRSMNENCPYCHLKKSPMQRRMVGVWKALTLFLKGDETADEARGLGGSMRLLLNMLVGP